ncbi:MAG: histidine kinase [Ekhidna sp.]
MNNGKNISLRIRLLAALIFWLLFLSIDVLKKNIFAVEDTRYLLSFYFFGFLLWFCITFPLFHFFQKSQKSPPLLRFVFLLLIGPIAGSVKVILSWTSFYLTIGLHDRGVPLFAFIIKQGSFHFVEATIIAWVVLILFFLSELYIKYRNKSLEAAELESQLIQAQLETLKMQLHPHFLFNAHNTISMLIRTKKYDQAIDMTSSLSDLLRATLNSGEKHFIELKDEIELMKKFLDIELIRFEDTLDVSIKISSDCDNALVPNLILQPIVENSFKHGISKHLGKSQLKIEAKRSGNRLIVDVFNTGPKVKRNFDMDKDQGIGIKNINARLKQSYQEDYTFNLINSNNGVICIVEIPWSEKD